MPARPQQSPEDFTDAVDGITSSNDESQTQEDIPVSLESNSDEELRAIREAIAVDPTSANGVVTVAEIQEVSHFCNKTSILTHFIQVLMQTQQLLIDLRGKYWVLHKRNKLLKSQKPGHGKKGTQCNMMDKELALTLKVDTVRFHGCKDSMTHCLWINSEIFPLSENPGIDLNSEERWLSACSIEDGVKTEFFAFIPRADRPLMAHKNFGSDVSITLPFTLNWLLIVSKFSKGVGNVHSEMVSNIKATAGAIFGLPSEYFVCNFPWDSQAECRSLVVNPHGKHTKFAPVLFPNPKDMQPAMFLKSAKLVKVRLFPSSVRI